jgi:hypothetical protein
MPLFQQNPDLVPGYTTKDAAGNDGDDTLHSRIAFYNVPNCIQTNISFLKEDDMKTVDLVFIDFIQPWVLQALTFMGENYNTSQIALYQDETLTELMAGWIKKHWKQHC